MSSACWPGKDIVVFTNNDTAYRAASALKAAGATITAIVDVRARNLPRQHATPQRRAAPNSAGPCRRRHQRQTTHQGIAGAAFRCRHRPRVGLGCAASAAIACWFPAAGRRRLHLASQAGERPVWSDDLQAFLPPKRTEEWVGAGGMTGSMATAAAISGGLGGRTGGSRRQAAARRPAAPEVDGFEADPRPAPVLEIKAKGKAFVDFQHDVTADDVRLARTEGFVSVEHLKRYTTLGMATDQGKTSNMPGLAIMAAELGKTIPEVGTTRFRPPFAPVSIGSLAAERYGDIFPERLTPMHDWHVEHGATMFPVGLWYRPQIFGLHGETIEQAYVREAKATRESVGIVDVSTLGKIAVQGPDAGEFLDRVYTNIFSTLPVGKARYGLMLREEGIAFDDGTTWRLGQNDFLMTTTTANAGKVMQHLEYYLDVIWPELKVHVTSVTDQWAGAAIGGPKSRDVLAACVNGTAVDNETLPFMGIVHGEIAGVPVMICRLSFSGERAYEVYCGAGHGTHVWQALMSSRKALRHRALRPRGAGHAAHRKGPCHRRGDRRPHDRA